MGKPKIIFVISLRGSHTRRELDACLLLLNLGMDRRQERKIADVDWHLSEEKPLEGHPGELGSVFSEILYLFEYFPVRGIQGLRKTSEPCFDIHGNLQRKQ